MSILSSTCTGKESLGVDLGLSMKWSACNLGARSNSDVGMYFAMGDVTGYYSDQVLPGMFTKRWYEKVKDEYDEPPYNQNYTYRETPIMPFDSAQSIWKGTWRLPNYKDALELIRNTEQRREQLDGVWGIRFYSNYDSNSIFIPFSGEAIDGCAKSNPRKPSEHFGLWTSSANGPHKGPMLGGDNKTNSPNFFGKLGYISGKFDYWVGLPIRPICNK